METLRPAVPAEVADAVAGAAGRRLAVRAGATKDGIGAPVDADAVLDVSGLDGITEYEPAELVLTAGAATPLAEIEAALAEHRQHLAFEPPSPPGATLGGVLAACESGPRRIAAGAGRDHFLGVAAVSGRGEGFRSGGRVVKNVTGYDLGKLLAGSFGTLAVMTEVTVKVLPAPEQTRTVLLAGLSDADAVAAMVRASGTPHEVSGLAHMPAPAAARSRVATVAGAAVAVTALRVEGPGPSVAHRAAALCDLSGGDAAELDDGDSRALWAEIRDGDLLPARGLLWRLSVPPSAGAAVAARLTDLEGEFLFDWAGGRIWLALGGDDPAAETVRTVVEGIGHATLVRAPAPVRRAVPPFHPQPAAVSTLQRRIKAQFDPDGRLNPGRMGF